VFVDSMSDLFHEGVTNEQIAAVFGVMAACPTHTFQVLTKRPALAVEWFRWAQEGNELADPFHRGEGDAHAWSTMANAVCSQHVSWPSWVGEEGEGLEHRWRAVNGEWPLPNVWLGVSVEDQPSADKRIPMLLKCPAAVRFVSYEPALGPVDFRMLHHDGITNIDALAGRHGVTLPLGGECDALDWIIIGGESGPGARPFDLAWARSTIAQCRTAGVKCFVKQLGAKPIDLIDERHGRDACPVKHKSVTLRDHKGGDMSEWPADLRVREMPRLVEDRR
jgi:protein gp37